MSNRDFEKLLHGRGLKRGSGSWLDYEAAKNLVNTYYTNPTDYERLIKIATDFIGI